MYETPVAIVGNVVSEPVERATHAGRPVANFRIASTPRVRDRAADKWTDGRTLFISVVCWGDLASNVARSVRKGESVLVIGRLTPNEFLKGEQLMTTLDITADAVGHNLARGTTRLERVRRAYATSAVPVGSDGLPQDVTDAALEQQLEAEMRAVTAELAQAGLSGSTSVEPLPDSGPLVPVA